MKRFATGRLLKEIDKMKKGPDGLNGDYFLGAQDFDDQRAKKISVSNVEIKGTKRTANCFLMARRECGESSSPTPAPGKSTRSKVGTAASARGAVPQWRSATFSSQRKVKGQAVGRTLATGSLVIVCPPVSSIVW